MMPSTAEAIRAILKTDPTVTPADRARLLALLRSGAGEKAGTALPESRVLRRGEAARRLGHSTRWLDDLARAGILQKVKLPGRRRAAGVREQDIAALIEGRKGEGEAV